MTGRELIIYILENGLEDEPMFEDGKILGLMTVEEGAAKMQVGTETIKTWVKMGYIDSYKFESLYIPEKFGYPFVNLEERTEK